MRSLCLLAALCSPLAFAQAVTVETNSMLRLPGNAPVLQLERLDVADFGTLLVPASVTQLNIGELHLGHEARIAIVPSEQAFALKAGRAELGSGSQISARGAPGTYQKAPSPGRNLDLRIDALSGSLLSVDARGGAGVPGYVGLDGANGDEPGCTWGAAGQGADGDNGGDGHPGAPGAQVRLQLPRNYPAAQIQVLVDGGTGGLAGAAGRPGAGGKAKGCFVYQTEGGKPGRPGLAGKPGPAGPAGSVTVQRL
ncbi:collagen-like protein [Pseudomonas batumici]|uniref:collagen-like protein n=1 Tax=Pseudomonas batumici TaxID=226910 RepID=UPI0030CB8595